MTDSISEAIADTETFTRPHIYDELFVKLRREAPVRWTTPSTTRPFWTIAKHADIIEVERQAEVFLNAPRLQLLTIEEEKAIEAAMDGSSHPTRTMLHMDGAEHRAYRGLTQGWFMPSKVKALEQKMADLSQEYVDRLENRGGTCDFVKDLAVWYPLRVIMTILGIPPEEEPELLRLTQNFVGREDTSITGDADRKGVMVNAAQDVFAFFHVIYEDRHKNPRDDLASLIAHAQIDGKPIGHLEAMSYYLLIGLAGHETTSATIAGGLLALIENPGELEKLRADPSLIGPATDEMLRWVTPTKQFFRTAARDYVLRGQTIKEGDALMLCFPSANRDEEVFEDPFSFKVDRTPNPQLSLGSGAHACLGQHLAKLEIRAFFRELIPRLKHVELAGDPVWLATTNAGGLTSLPIRYELQPSKN